MVEKTRKSKNKIVNMQNITFSTLLWDISLVFNYRGYRDSVLLLREIKYGASRSFIALLVVEIQSRIEKNHFRGTIFNLVDESFIDFFSLN